MEPVKKKKAGRELGNAAACAEIVGVTWETYQWYVRQGRPAGNPPPGPVEIDNVTRQSMYPLKEVRAWHAARPGRGNWGGIGARARTKDTPNARTLPDRTALTKAEVAALEQTGALASRPGVKPTGVDTVQAGAVTAATLEASEVTGATLEANSVDAASIEATAVDVGTLPPA